MQRCKQMSDIAKNGVMFQSESSAGKEYHAFAFRLNEMDFCPCVAFVMARNKEAKRLGLKDKGISAAGLASDCKHLKEIRRVTCQWTQKSVDEYRYDETCPNCGGPVVEEGKKMIPDGAGADHVDDLRAMLAELKGTAEPEPELDVREVGGTTIVAPPGVLDDVVEAAEDVIGTAEEAPPVDRRHGTIPDDPAEWLEDLIASRNGVIPTGDDWKQLREMWGPIYGKRKIDAAYKAASTPDAVLRRRIVVDREAADAETREQFGYNPFRSGDHVVTDEGTTGTVTYAEGGEVEVEEDGTGARVSKGPEQVAPVTFEHPEVIPVLQASDDPAAAAFGNLAAAIQAHVVKPVNDTSNFNAMLAVPAGDDTEEPTAVQIEDEDGADGTADELLDSNGDADPAFFGTMVSVDVAMECVEQVLGEYLGGSFAGQAYSRIEELIHARITLPGTLAQIIDIPLENTPEAAAQRLATLVKP